MLANREIELFVCQMKSTTQHNNNNKQLWKLSGPDVNQIDIKIIECLEPAGLVSHSGDK